MYPKAYEHVQCESNSKSNYTDLEYILVLFLEYNEKDLLQKIWPNKQAKC
jgi:hypothetical protein